jgi:hypothetical protein
MKKAYMMNRIVIFVLVLFFVVGCGMSGSTSKDSSTADSVATVDLNATDSGNEIATATVTPSDDTPSVEEQPVADALVEEETILPQTISMEFPQVLKQSPTATDNNQTDSEDNQTIENNQTTSRERVGYEQLKKDIAEIEDVIKITKLNLVILEEVMPEVLDRCEGMIACTFEDKALSFVMDNRTISKIEQIADNNRSFDELNGSKVFLGVIEFKKYDDSTKYSYGLTFHIDSEISFKSNDNLLKTVPFFRLSDGEVEDNKSIIEFQTLKWSEDNEDVITTYVYEDNQTSSNISIHYLTDSDGKRIMHIYDNHNSQTDGTKENMNLTLANKEDNNSTFTLRTNSIEEFKDGNETNISSFSANAEISEDGALLLFSGKISDENSTAELGMTSEVACENNESCDSNSSEPIEEVDIELYELKITGGELENGSYLLLAPNTDIERLESIDIFDLSLGTFTIFEDKTQGELHDDSYENMLNKLIIVKIIESQESTDMFEIVSDDKKPNLKIVKY